MAGGAVEVRFGSKIENTNDTKAKGASEDIEIKAKSLLLDARNPSNPESKRGRARIAAGTNSKPGGNAGSIDIRVGSLRMIGFKTDKGANSGDGISSNTSGNGNAGKITIMVEGDFIMTDRAQIGARSNSRSAKGDANDIIIEAGSLFLSKRSFITSQVRSNSKGNPGNITITAKDKIEITNSDIKTVVSDNAGNPESAKKNPGGVGNITITAHSLSLKDGKLEALNQGKIPASDITVNATDFVKISGLKRLSGIFTETKLGTQGVRDNKSQGGRIEITTGKLTVSNDSFVSTRGIGGVPGGDIIIEAKEVEVTQGGQILANALNTNALNTIPFEVVELVD
ncbi:MAG: hypothetical protein F6K37_22895 [Moorea sp. SIO4E2]|uniref:hypothetical protein n=1 Tax=Moorena sp. SIO4E2 TaxID=2607826 RepID=UPI0013B9AE57|nr:hypothetical protein [Moorena sp. SIO4E2]NEQ08691.1 hypothetical protein [Moorena sp. SIO4E2]